MIRFWDNLHGTFDYGHRAEMSTDLGRFMEGLLYMLEYICRYVETTNTAIIMSDVG